jgi:transposase
MRQVQEAFVPAVIEGEPGTVADASMGQPEAAIVLEFGKRGLKAAVQAA